MPSETPIPNGVKYELPENGYESPQAHNEDMFFGNGSGADGGIGGRLRTTYTGGSRATRSAVDDANSQDQSDAESTTERGTRSDEEGGSEKQYGIRDRIGCFSWTCFTMTMATGGIANVLSTIPYRSEWLRIIGVVIMLFNIGIFVTNCTLITLRFRWNAGSFKRSFTSPSESLFIPCSVVSLGTILINIAQYGIPYCGPWFHTVMQVFFWLYASLSFIASAAMYLIIWSTQSFPVHTMTPIWIFPAYPALMLAPLASQIINALPDVSSAQRINAIAIAYGAVCIQGTGFMVSLMIYSAFIYRLMTQKLPREKTRPGMFVSVGPSGFTVAGIVTLGEQVEKFMPNGFMGNMSASNFLRLLSIMFGLWIWGLCVWFFLVSVGAHWQVMHLSGDEHHHLHFDMTWYSFIFPNTALITATLALGKSMPSPAIEILGTVMAVLLVILWLIIFFMMIRAILFKNILWPGEIDGHEIHWRKWITSKAPALQSGHHLHTGILGN